ncbi:hypothetical protein K3552_13800 [Leisingera aquaemixtae]|uniref:NAD(P)/FAD-dependent oxidoreductase n=1 Tax=Leisingera aquaemixtae TaxID=1396826 RepID=UPI0021A77044|nr:FAD-dependent monooxygenase [Leisingera aquaemixtae]UWQ36569.1 hypothetical protein K3552_13800 [Leisingera aquaemixtae]
MTGKLGHAPRYDVTIIGDGPGGALSALALASRGVRVAMIGSGRPVPNRIVSIPRNAVAALGEIGLGDWLRNNGTPLRRRVSNWEGSVADLKMEVGSVLVDHKELLSATHKLAAMNGAVFLNRQCFVRREDVCAGRIAAPASGTDASIDITSEFIIDATGRGTTLGKSQVRLGRPLIAVEAQIRTSLPPGSMAFLVARSHWVWVAARKRDVCQATIFLPKGSFDRTFGTFLRQALAPIELDVDYVEWENCTVTDASFRLGPGQEDEWHLPVGNSIAAVDPILSSGWYLAAISALQSAVSIYTALSKPTQREVANWFYRLSMARIRDHLERSCSELYALRKGFGGIWEKQAHDFENDRRERGTHRAHKLIQETLLHSGYIPIIKGNTVEAIELEAGNLDVTPENAPVFD